MTEDERTTPMGMYNYGRSYHIASTELRKIDIKGSSHSHAPVAVLQFHTIELFLKSFLRLKGFAARKLAT